MLPTRWVVRLCLVQWSSSYTILFFEFKLIFELCRSRCISWQLLLNSECL